MGACVTFRDVLERMGGIEVLFWDPPNGPREGQNPERRVKTPNQKSTPIFYFLESYIFISVYLIY